MAKEKAKPKGSKAKKEEYDFEDTEIDDYSEVNDDFSEERIENQKEANIFGKAYKWLEDKYYSFSGWLTKKGINLNKVNDFLEEKGIPAFVFVSCLTIIILAIIFFLIINFATKTTVEFSIADYSGTKLSDVDVKIYDTRDKTKFNDTISDGHKARLALKSGIGYTINATKSGYADYANESYVFTRGEKIIIKFNENVTFGNLKLTIVDSETKKAIEKYTATLRYTVSGKSQEQTGTPTSLGQINFSDVPVGKDLSLTIEADGYETISQSVKINTIDETLNLELQFDTSAAELEGIDSRVVILTNSDTGDVLDDCNVTAYNLAGEIIGSGITQLGKFTFTAKAGSAIRFVVTKEGYRIYDSDKENKTFRLQKSEETFTATLVRGSSDFKVTVVEELVGPLTDADVSLYNLAGNLLLEETTLLDGQVIFTGLDKNTDYVVTACKEDYLCSQYFVNIDNGNELEAKLTKIGSEATYKLSVYVYDGSNNPVSNANVLIYRKLNEKYVPIGLGPLQVDLTGFTSVFTRQGDIYKVVGVVGDSNVSQEITIDQFKDNKVILIISAASKEVTLTLKDMYGNPVTDGYVTVKSKTGEILYEGYIDAENPAMFSTKGYKDLIVEYMDPAGETTIASAVVGDGDELVVSLRPMAEGASPIISFLEIRDSSNNLTSILSKDKDYYLVFDLQFPLEAKNCGVHFRVGQDTETDSENLIYGITGFKADTTSFRYSTTYNYGQQSIDSDNVGAPNELNKWLELYWQSYALTNKQIMLKVKATDIGELPVKYRAWCDQADGIYRDPEDTILGTSRNNSSRQSLYAETKEKRFNVLDRPADCSNNLCIEYKFLDKDGFDYSKESFFATIEDMYLLELSYYSTQSGDLSISAETDASHPIIGLVNYQDTDLFPSSKMDSQETKLASTGVSLQSGVYKKQYLLFNAKNTGITYIDIQSTYNSLATEKRLSFEIKNKRNLEVTVSEILPYNSPISIEVRDMDSKVAINNALVKLKDEFGDLISSTKKAKNGKYIINQNFSSSKPNLEVTAPGYAPYNKQLMIADTGLIYAPNSIEINFGDEISQESEIIKLVNKGNTNITDLTYSITPIDEVSGLTIETQLPVTLNPGAPSEIEVVSVIDTKIKFISAKYILTIYGFVGNKQVAKEIEIIIYKGKVKEDCLDIKPREIYSYVGISEGSENEITATLVNNCKKAVTITPELLKAKGTVIKKDENLEIILPSVTIEPNEEITDYTITVKNNKARKSTKSYVFEIAWRNAYYALPNTKLNVDLVDYSKTMKITPPVSIVSMNQYNEEIAASNKTVFSITNTGEYTLKDIQISRLEEKFISNIQDKIEPLSFEEIKPGQTKNVAIIYETKVKDATLATLYYKVTAQSPGSKDPVEAKFTVDFRVSSASCLKVDQKKISFYTRIGEEKVKLINVTNQCAEPISYLSYDINPNISPNDFTLAFGEGTQVAFVPASSIPYIGVGQTVPYYLKVKPTRYFTPRFENRFTVIGSPINNTALSMVTGEIIWISIEVEAPDQDTVEDLERIEENISLKVCDADEKMDVTMPVIVVDCKEKGYCDSESAAELILEKIQELHNVVIDTSRQLNNELAQTTCSLATSQQNGCPITEILKPDQLKEFRNIPIYLQNDSLTENTLRVILANTKEASKYSTIKDYTVRENVGFTTGGLQTFGNIIHIQNKMQGCGRYKITIDGAIATKDQKTLAPERAYFFVTIDSNTTAPCAKSIENVRMYLPKDSTYFKKSNMGDTWLTLISGDENIGKTIAKNVFDNEERFQLRTDNTKKFSQLDVAIGEISENDKAIAKLYFNDPIKSATPKPEKVNVIINNYFSINKEGEEAKYSEGFVKQVSENIKDIVNGTPADICISKDKNYMLILSFEAADYGALSLKAQTDKLQLGPLEKCTVVTVKSAVDESITIDHIPVIGVKTKFNYQGKDYQDKMSIVLEKDKDTDFNVCFLGDIGEVTNWSDKQVKITAESKYRTGKINSERISDVNITLLNYGITPVELLGIIDNYSGKLGKEDNGDDKVFYTYISWDKTYNKNNTEEYCKTLEAYFKSLGDKTSMFVKPEVCDFKETKAETSARNSRALKRAGSYLAGCVGACAFLTTGEDLLWNVIPFLGQAKILSDIAWNCGLGCGLPAVTMYSKESGIADGIKEFIYKMPILGDFAKLIGIVFEKVGSYLGAIANAIMGGGSGEAEAQALASSLENDVAAEEADNLDDAAVSGEVAVGIRDLTKISISGVSTFTPQATTNPSTFSDITDDLVPITIGGGGGSSPPIVNNRLISVNPTTKTVGTLPINISDSKLIKYIDYAGRSPTSKYWFYAKTHSEQTELNVILKKIGSGTNKDLLDGFYKNLTITEQKRFGQIIANHSDGAARFSSISKDGFWANPSIYPDEKALNGKFKPNGTSFSADVDNYIKSLGKTSTTEVISVAEKKAFIAQAEASRDELRAVLQTVDDDILKLGTPAVGSAEEKSLRILQNQQNQLKFRIKTINDVADKVKTAPLIPGTNDIDVSAIKTDIDSSVISKTNKGIENIDKSLRYVKNSGTGTKVLAAADRTALESQITNTSKNIQTQLDEITNVKKVRFNNTSPLTGDPLKSEWDELIKAENSLNSAKSQIDDIGKELGGLVDNGAGGFDVPARVETKINNISDIKMDIDNANTALSGLTSGTKVTTMTSGQIDDAIRNATKSAKSSAKQAAKLDSQIKSLEKNRGYLNKGLKEKQLDKLKSQRDILKDAGAKYENAAKELDNVKSGMGSGSTANISDDVMKSMDDAAKSVKSAGLPTKFQKILKGGAKLGVDMIVIAISNWAGEEYLQRLSNEDGQFANMVYQDVPLSEFEKNIWYKVTVMKSGNKYDMVIEKEIPSVSGDTIIQYKDNKEIKELLTSEHQEELLQSNTPQVQSKDWSEIKEEKDTEDPSESSATLEELQMRMYSQYEEKLQEYTKCKFKGEAVCLDLGAAFGPNQCSTFAQRVAEKNYKDIAEYINGHAWVIGNNNNIVWNAKTDSLTDFEKNLVPGSIITIGITKGTDCSTPSHAVLYVGKDSYGQHMIIHQLVSDVYLEPLAKRFTSTPNTQNTICQIVIPKSGYAVYDNFVNNNIG